MDEIKKIDRQICDWRKIVNRGWDQEENLTPTHIQNKFENILDGLQIIYETLFWSYVDLLLKVTSNNEEIL